MPVVAAFLFGYGFRKCGAAGGSGEGSGGFGGGRVLGGGRWRRRRFFLALGSPDDENVADALNGRGIEPVADVGEQRLAFFALYLLEAHLDEFVRLQRTLQFGENIGGEAVIGDGDDGAQGMGAGAQFLPFGGCEFDLGHFVFNLGRGRDFNSI